MGIVVFLLEKGHMEESIVARVKADLIYRLLSEQDNIFRFQEKIRLFKWTVEQGVMWNRGSGLLFRSLKIKHEFLLGR